MHTAQAGCECAACGGLMREIGQDVSKVLDYERGSFHVVRHVKRIACATRSNAWQLTRTTELTNLCHERRPTNCRRAGHTRRARARSLIARPHTGRGA